MALQYTSEGLVRGGESCTCHFPGSIAAAAIEGNLCYGTWKFIAQWPGTIAYLYVGVTLASLLSLVALGKSIKSYAYDVLTWTIDSERDQRSQTRERVVSYTENSSSTSQRATNAKIFSSSPIAWERASRRKRFSKKDDVPKLAG